MNNLTDKTNKWTSYQNTHLPFSWYEHIRV